MFMYSQEFVGLDTSDFKNIQGLDLVNPWIL